MPPPASAPAKAGPSPFAPAAAPSITNRAASASSGSSSVIVTSASPIGGRFTVPLKMQSAMRSARSDLWLCSPNTHEIASTTFDLPHPFGPTMQVVPTPANVTTVRSQKDLNPVISTFRSFSKVSPFVSASYGVAPAPAGHRSHPRPARFGTQTQAQIPTARIWLHTPNQTTFRFSKGRDSRRSQRDQLGHTDRLAVARQKLWQVLVQRPLPPGA